MQDSTTNPASGPGVDRGKASKRRFRATCRALRGRRGVAISLIVAASFVPAAASQARPHFGYGGDDSGSAGPVYEQIAAARGDGEDNAFTSWFDAVVFPGDSPSVTINGGSAPHPGATP